MGIAERIRNARKLMSLSQQGLAQKLGVSFMTIRRWEASEVQPRYDEINRLAKELNVSVEYLMGLEDKPEKPEITSGVDNDNVELGFWGTVADKARKLARIGNREDISAALFMLKMAVSSLDKAAAAAV